ncbi:MAG TPA: hypothetical protein VG474_15880 [Solirubrobacteraceae bacterium]|nr:hypothetical protein [Solirubrobacteraceae bacterium]
MPVRMVLRGLPLAVGGVGLAFFVVQAALGWGLGVAGAGVTVLVAVCLLAVLVVADALEGGGEEADQGEAYDRLALGAIVLAIAVAIASLYLPMPWGGVAAAAVLAAVIVALRLR